MSMTFGKTKGTAGLLKLTKFDIATLIVGDIWPQQYHEKQPKHARPLMHGFLVLVILSVIMVVIQTRSLMTKVEPAKTVTFTSAFSSAMDAKH